MPVKTESIREIQVLSQGREPKNQDTDHLTAANGTPTDDDDGFDVSGLSPRPIVGFVGVRLRAVPEADDAEVEILTVVEGDTYRITFDATDYDYVAQPGDGVEEIAAGLMTAMGAATVAKAAPVNVGGGKIEFTGVKLQTYTLAASVPAGTGTISAVKDATSVGWRLWILAPSVGWCLVPNTTREGVVFSELDRFNVSGAQRLYVEILTTDGRVKPIFQPALLEE